MLPPFLLSFLLLAWQASASHFRYMSLSWQQTATLSYDFTVTLAYRQGSSGSGRICPEFLYFGDGGASRSQICGNTVDVQDAAGNAYTTVTGVVSHTYANPGQYTAYVYNSARISGLQNGPDGAYRGELVINVGGPATTSPQISTTATRQVAVGVSNVFTLSTTGGVGPLTCALTPTYISQLRSQPTAGGQTISIASDCTASWDLSSYSKVGDYYGFGVTVKDSLGNSATVDFLLISAAGTLPDCNTRGLPSGGSTLTVDAGSPANVFADGSSSDNEALSFSSQGLPAGASFVSDGQNNGVYTNHLDYTPKDSDVGKTSAISYSYATSSGLQCVSTFYVAVIDRPAKITNCAVPKTQTSGSDTTCTLAIPDFTADTTYSGTNVDVTQSPVSGTSANVGSNQVVVTVSNSQGSDTCTTSFSCVPAVFAPVIDECSPSIISISGSDSTCDLEIPDFTQITPSNSATSGLKISGTGPFTVEQSVPVGTTAPGGVSTITITATNSAGSATCDVTFECKLAKFAPNFTTCPPAITQTSNSDKVCDLPIPDFTKDGVATGTGQLTYTQDQAAGTIANVGSNPVVVTVENEVGTDECTTSFTCTLADFPPKVETCASSVTQKGDANFVCTLPDFTAAPELVISGTSPISIVQDKAVGSQAANGTTIVTIKAENTAGSSSCNVDFICELASPVEPPKITKCSDSITVVNKQGKCSVADFTTGIVADGTAPLVLTQNPLQGTPVNAGSTDVSIFVTNSAGSDTCKTKFICAKTETKPDIKSCPKPVTEKSGSCDKCDRKIPAFTCQPDFAVEGSDPITVTQTPCAGSHAGKGKTVVTIVAKNKKGSTKCTTAFTCVVPEKPSEHCIPYFKKFPAMAAVDLFSDYSPDITGKPTGGSDCSKSIKVTYKDAYFASPACSNAIAIHRLWTVTDEKKRSSNKLQMIGIKQPESPLFGGAAPYQLYTVGVMNLTSSVIAGQAATGCDLVGKKSIFGKSDECTYSKFTLVGENLQMDNSQVYYGDAAYSKQYTAAKTSPFKAVHKTPLGFSTIQSALKSQSARLAELKGKIPAYNFGSVSGKTDLKLSGSSQLFNIFYVSPAQFAAAKTLRVQVPAGSLVLVNIARPAGSINWPATSLTTSATNVLFNFVGFAKLNVNSGVIQGSILAPSMHLTFGKATLAGGQIAALTINGNGFKTTCSERNYMGNMKCDWQGGKYGTPYKAQKAKTIDGPNTVRRAKIGRAVAEH